MQSPKPSRMSFLALSEWVMVLPATVFLAAAALRQLQPRQYEPSHTSWLIFEWTIQHVSNLGAAILFNGLPGLAVIIGCAVILQTWRKDESFRQDLMAALEAFRRHIVIAFVVAATALAGAIFVFAFVHILTD
jgi:hypothetical protein